MLWRYPGQGKYTPRDAYDALETAVTEYVREHLARKLLENDAHALSKLRSLLQRLPTGSFPVMDEIPGPSLMHLEQDDGVFHRRRSSRPIAEGRVFCSARL